MVMFGARCRLAYGPADTTATADVPCFSKIQIDFTFMVPAHLGSPRQRAVKQVLLLFSIENYDLSFPQDLLTCSGA